MYAGDFTNVHSILNENFTEEALRARPRRLKTGFQQLDQVLGGGLGPGLTVLGASPGLGKSTFALQLAGHVAETERPVLYFSLEMPKDRLAAKLLSRQVFQAEKPAGEPADPVQLRRVCITADETLRFEAVQGFSEEKRRTMERARAEIPGSDRLYVIDKPLSAGEIKRAAQRFMQQEQAAPPLVIVDYLQILPPDTLAGNSKQAVENSLSQMVELAHLGSGVPVLLISSLNRGSYTESIQMDSFKETGGIEYSADVLLGLQFRACHERGALDINGEKNRFPREVEILVLKQRYGSSGEAVPFQYYAEYDCFEEAMQPEAVQEAPPPEAKTPEPKAVPAEAPKAGKEAEAAPDGPEDRASEPAAEEPPAPAPQPMPRMELLCMNNTKIANEIRKGHVRPGERNTCRVSRKDGKELLAEYELSGPLSCFDCDVADTIYTLYTQGAMTFSPETVMRRLSGDRRQTATAQKKQAITASIEALRNTRIVIQYPVGLWEEGADSDRTAEFSGMFLAVTPQPDAKKTLYRFDTGGDAAPMPLYRIGELTRQMITVPEGLLCVKSAGGKKLSDTVENVSLKRFLIRRLETIRNPKSKIQTRTIRYLSPQRNGGMLTEIGVLRENFSSDATWRQKHAGVQKAACSVLEYFQRIGYIDGFTHNGEGVTIQGTIHDPKLL